MLVEVGLSCGVVRDIVVLDVGGSIICELMDGSDLGFRGWGCSFLFNKMLYHDRLLLFNKVLYNDWFWFDHVILYWLVSYNVVDGGDLWSVFQLMEYVMDDWLGVEASTRFRLHARILDKVVRDLEFLRLRALRVTTL